MREMVFRIGAAPLESGRPRWLTAGTIRLLSLCAFIIAVGMIRPRLTPHAAGIVLIVGGVAVVGGVGHSWSRRRALQRGCRCSTISQRIADALMLEIRRIGLPLLGLAFFLFWTFVYLGLWWFRPEGAFGGLDPRPRFADFFYYSVSTAFVSPPGDIVAQSRGARSEERDNDRDADCFRAPDRVPVEFRGLEDTSPATRGGQAVRSSALKLVLVVFGGIVALWLLGALIQGLLVSLSLTTSRFFLYWWFQKFGIGVLVGFCLGLLAGWLLLRNGSEEGTAIEARTPTSDHLEEARMQLAALEKELASEREDAS
jgi:hypothetical protein